MTHRRGLITLLALCLVLALLPTTVGAETTEVASGTCGENLTWVLTARVR